MHVDVPVEGHTRIQTPQDGERPESQPNALTTRQLHEELLIARLLLGCGE
jgi:hypothetical protein